MNICQNRRFAYWKVLENITRYDVKTPVGINVFLHVHTSTLKKIYIRRLGFRINSRSGQSLAELAAVKINFPGRVGGGGGGRGSKLSDYN